MGKLAILVPEYTDNIVENPRFEYATTGYTQNGSVITRVLTRARFGRASCRVVTTGAVHNEGIYYSAAPGDTNEPYTGSVYVRGAGIVRVRLVDQTNTLEWSSEPKLITDDRWHRFSVKGVVGGVACADLRLYVETAEKIQLVTFYVDGFDIENKHYATTYTDGDLELELDPHDGAPYFEWTGRRHASESFRTERYRPGGRIVDLTQGLDFNLFPTQSSGLGMPPVNLKVQQFLTQERVLVQGTRALPRSVQMTFWARKDEDTQVCSPASLNELHRAREALEAVIKPDRVWFDQPFLLRYKNNVEPMDLEAYYEAGLEWSGDMRFPWHNSFGARFFCPNPYWKEDSQDILELTESQTVANADYILMRRNGEWQEMEGGADATVYDILAHSSGLIYACGSFTTIGAGGGARFAVWDGEAWDDVVNDPDNGTVYCMAEMPNGDIIIGGTFTTINAVTFNRIAYYNFATDTWTQMGLGGGANAGLNGQVNDIAVDMNGIVWIAGDFTQDANAQVLNYVCSYDPVADTFSALTAAPGLEATAWAVEIDIDGLTVYFGGEFTDVFGGGGGTYDYVIKYDQATAAFAVMAEKGMDNNVYVLKRTLDGRIYAGGLFTEAGEYDAQMLAMWNRKEWYPLGRSDDGANNTVWDIFITNKGEVLFGGQLTAVTGSTLARRIGSWNGTRFSHLDIVFPGAATVHAIAVQGDDIYVGFSTSGNAVASEIHTAINNGTAHSWPILDVFGPARLEWLENQDTGAIIKLDLDIQADEQVFIDFRQGRLKAYSFFRGNVIEGILADSDVGEFCLLPGENTIAFLAEDTDEGTEITLRWPVLHWSFDAR